MPNDGPIDGSPNEAADARRQCAELHISPCRCEDELRDWVAEYAPRVRRMVRSKLRVSAHNASRVEYIADELSAAAEENAWSNPDWGDRVRNNPTLLWQWVEWRLRDDLRREGRRRQREITFSELARGDDGGEDDDEARLERELFDRTRDLAVDGMASDPEVEETVVLERFHARVVGMRASLSAFVRSLPRNERITMITEEGLLARDDVQLVRWLAGATRRDEAADEAVKLARQWVSKQENGRCRCRSQADHEGLVNREARTMRNRRAELRKRLPAELLQRVRELLASLGYRDTNLPAA